MSPDGSIESSFVDIYKGQTNSYLLGAYSLEGEQTNLTTKINKITNYGWILNVKV